jgi:UDP-N-acetylglucosamine 4,6-dehydratase
MLPLRGKVLVTGGTGTLGSAIAKMAELYSWPCSITVFSRGEFLQAQMRSQFPSLRFVLGDVRDARAVHSVVAGHDVVIHAAAMKRIPECEAQPMECVASNLQGSINVLNACRDHNVPTVVGISTDKAVQATTVYGASKLMMEGLFKAHRSPTGRAVLVRYGNVLASRGSVLPLWEKAAREGKVLKITDPSMTRFWMTPQQAVELVSTAIGLDHGDILVPRMKSCTMGELAQWLFPGSKTAQTGKRSQEKSSEDLVHAEERFDPHGQKFLQLSEHGSESFPDGYSTLTCDRFTESELVGLYDEAKKFYGARGWD